MKKVLRLFRVQIWASLVDMLSIGNSRGKKSKAMYAGLVLFVVTLGSVSFFYSYMIGLGLMMYDSIELLPALMMAATSILVLMTSVFKIKGTIFGFKDYDMVMSLPVSTGGIVASRLALLYSFNMVFVGVIMLPMMIAYGILVKPAVMFYLLGTLTIFFIPLVPIIIASLIGTIITYVASKFRYSNLFNIIFSIGLLVAIVGFSFTTKESNQEFVNISRALTEQVNSTYLLAQMYTKAVIDFDIMASINFIAISMIAFLLYSLLIGMMFKRINTIIMTGRYRVNYKMGELSQSSPSKALYRKELKRYFSSPLYVLNTGFGIVMLTLGAVALIFVDLEKLLGEEIAAQMLNNSAPMFVSFCIITCCTTMASISLEGKNLWIVKSLPVTPKAIFMAKLFVNLTILAPAVLDAILISIILKLEFMQGIYMVLVGIVCAVFIALYGLLVNLKLPNFTWTTEVAVIKQSLAAMVAIFTGMGIVGLQFLFLYFIPTFNVAYLIYTCLMILVDFVLYRILMTWGSKRFATL